jgi:spermidine/putrescine transport system substrate-binding protein
MKGSIKAATAGAAFAMAPTIIGRAPISSAEAAFENEELRVVSWSGNYEQMFRETVIDPFNDKYGTKAETIGGWDQIVSQIQAAPADNPPFDITVSDEYIASAGLAGGLYLKTDKSKIPNVDAVYPWFYEVRPAGPAEYGIPFGGGSALFLLRASLKLEPSSWGLLWDDRLKGKITLDSGAWWYSLGIPALMSAAMPGLDEMYDLTTAEPLFAEMKKLKVAKWFRDGAEQANILNQEEADAAMSYSSDAYTFMQQQPGEYVAGVPGEGAPAWSDWYFKVRGNHHGDLADLFMNYLLEKETQDRFLSKSLMFMARRDVSVPDHWSGYPQSNDDYHRMFRIITMEGWDKISASYQAFDDRWKQVVVATAN